MPLPYPCHLQEAPARPLLSREPFTQAPRVPTEFRTWSHFTWPRLRPQGLGYSRRVVKMLRSLPLPFFIFIAPNEKMKQVLKKTVEEAKAIVSKVSFLN